MNLFTTKAADMICIGSKTTNPKHQMTFIPKDAQTATVLKLPRLGQYREAKEERAGLSGTRPTPSLKMKKRIAFHFEIIIVIYEFH